MVRNSLMPAPTLLTIQPNGNYALRAAYSIGYHNLYLGVVWTALGLQENIAHHHYHLCHVCICVSFEHFECFADSDGLVGMGSR